MTSMRVDRLSSREDIVPRLQALSVPPFSRPISHLSLPLHPFPPPLTPSPPPFAPFSSLFPPENNS